MLGGLPKRSLHFVDVLVFSENPNLSKQMNKISHFLKKKHKKGREHFGFGQKLGGDGTALF